MTRYYRSVEGAYLGGFDGAPPPAGAIEVPDPPAHALARWDTGAGQWASYTPPTPPLLRVTGARVVLAIVAGVNTFVDVALPVALADATYDVWPAAAAVTGTPPVGAFVPAVLNRTAAGFRLRVAAAPGAGNDVTFACLVLRVGAP